jgi:hypothetical protein
VQFPADQHDTELRDAEGVAFWTPDANDAGNAVPHTPPVNVCVNASVSPAAFLNRPAAVQFPADQHDTELRDAEGVAFWTPDANDARNAVPHTPPVDDCVNAS